MVHSHPAPSPGRYHVSYCVLPPEPGFCAYARQAECARHCRPVPQHTIRTTARPTTTRIGPAEGHQAKVEPDRRAVDNSIRPVDLTIKQKPIQECVDQIPNSIPLQSRNRRQKVIPETQSRFSAAFARNYRSEDQSKGEHGLSGAVGHLTA